MELEKGLHTANYIFAKCPESYKVFQYGILYFPHDSWVIPSAVSFAEIPNKEQYHDQDLFLRLKDS